MPDPTGSPVTKALREMLRNREVLDKIREVYETGLARNEVTQREFNEKMQIVESIEREVAEEESA
jgi:predicted RNA binding protein with dsRBD fold (UPF0201 family)